MTSGTNPTILYIGTTGHHPTAASRSLEHAGYVLHRTKPSNALAAIEKSPGLVVLELGFSGLDAGLCKEIGLSARERSIPLLLLGSGENTDSERLNALNGFVDAYVEQISPPPVLVGAVERLLRERHESANLRSSSERWRIALDAIRDGVCLLDGSGRVEHVNRAMAALTGRRLEDFAGIPHTEVFEGAAEPDCGWPFERMREDASTASAEVEWRGRRLQISAAPLLDETGRLSGAVETVCDITARKQHERDETELLRQLATERARLEQVLQQMPLGVVMAEAPSGATLLVNEHVDRIWLASNPMAAASVEDYGAWRGIHPGGKPYKPEEWPLARSISTGEIVTDEEIQIERSDGSRGVIRVSSAPSRDQEGRIVAGVMAFHDVTERTQLEEQLRQSQKMDAVGRLAGGVAHDFNNLLTIIGGYAQMVAERLDPKDALRRDVETVLEATERATQLTRQLLTFSRRQIIQPKSLDINRLVTRLNKILRRVIGEDIELKTSLASGLPRVKADPGQLEQVVLNLALNARDAMPKGGRITIETYAALIDKESALGHGALAPGHYLVLAFRDTGTGIEPSVMGQIFEPFFTTKPKGKGTGLGLSTVYGIVKQAGGEVRAESAPGEGATFRIYLPEDADAPPATRPSTVTKASLKGSETVLLVEDELEVRRLTKEMLTRLGYTVLEAGSAHDAVRAWDKQAGAIDMLLTDVVMPHTSGRELADQLKSRRPDLKVLFMSGYTDEVIARHGALESSTAFLQKPFTQDQLAKKVRNVLDAS